MNEDQQILWQCSIQAGRVFPIEIGTGCMLRFTNNPSIRFYKLMGASQGHDYTIPACFARPSAHKGCRHSLANALHPQYKLFIFRQIKDAHAGHTHQIQDNVAFGETTYIQSFA